MELIANLAQQYAALFVSICALLLTINQAVMTRRHNKLTVRPHLTSFTDRILHPEITGVTQVKLTLSNNGVGPAVIRSYEPMLDGQPLDPTKFVALLATAKEVLPVSILDQECRFAFFRKGYVMAKDEEKCIALLAIVPTLDTDFALLEKAEQRFHIRVTYESIYGERFGYDSRNHF